MFDVIDTVTGAVIAGLFYWIGKADANGKARQRADRLLCGCGHHLALHGEGGCQHMTRAAARANDYTCPCPGYTKETSTR